MFLIKIVKWLYKENIYFFSDKYQKVLFTFCRLTIQKWLIKWQSIITEAIYQIISILFNKMYYLSSIQSKRNYEVYKFAKNTLVMILKWIASPVWISLSAAETKTSWMMFMAFSTDRGTLSTPTIFFKPTWHKDGLKSCVKLFQLENVKIYVIFTKHKLRS